MTTAALIVAAGRGSRAGGEKPKQYQLLGGKPLLRYSLETLLGHAAVARVAVVIHPDDSAAYAEAVGDLAGHPRLAPPCPGGAARQDSVRLGLEALAAEQPSHVLIHDAARPFLGQMHVDHLLDMLAQAPGAVLAVPVVDTLKRDDGGYARSGVERQGLWRVQTPQAFRFPKS